MNASTTIALLSALFVLAVVPGPSDFTVVARALTTGFAQAALMVAGIVAADAVLIIIAVTSLVSLTEWIQGLTLWLKCLGGAFLIVMGLSMFRAPAADAAALQTASTKAASSFSSGFLITLADPKAVLFYMALLPAFADLGKLGVRDVLLILLAASAAICTVKLSYAWLASRARRLIEDPSLRHNLNRMGGMVMLSIGVLLLMQTWNAP